MKRTIMRNSLSSVSRANAAADMFEEMFAAIRGCIGQIEVLTRAVAVLEARTAPQTPTTTPGGVVLPTRGELLKRG